MPNREHNHTKNKKTKNKQTKEKVNPCDFEQSVLIRHPEWDMCSRRQRTSFGSGGATAVIILIL